jgi:hypothetical protein
MLTHYIACIPQGMLSEFSAPEGNDQSLPIYQFQWVYINGLLGIVFSMGLLYTALRSRGARSSLYGTGLSYVYIFDENCLHIQTTNTPDKTFRVAKELNC